MKSTATTILLLAVVPSSARGQSFVDIAPQLGATATFFNSSPAAFGDYDGDSDPDLFLAINGGSFDPNDILFRNDAGQSFIDVAAAAGVQGPAQLTFQLAGAWGDYDRDGDLDLFVITSGGSLHHLYENNGNGTFNDVTATAGLSQPSQGGSAAGWADLDGDGWIDLFVCNWNHPDQLFQNNKDGTFTDVAGAAGMSGGGRPSSDVSFADYDLDGDVDVQVASVGTANPCALYQNDGTGNFTDVTGPAGLGQDRAWGAGTWADYDNDGDLDLYVPDFTPPASACKHYRNNGDGTFTEVGQSTGLHVVHPSNLIPRGASWADYDSDGFLDVYVAFNKSNSGTNPPQNYLFRNDGNGHFVDVTASTQTGGVTAPGSPVWTDVDGDLHPDLHVVNEWGTPNRMFRNPGFGNHGVRIFLEGNASNREGLGAIVRARVSGVRQIRQVFGGTGFRSQGEAAVTFGLGAANLVEELIVEWPSGMVDRWTLLAADREYRLIEGSSPWSPYSTYCTAKSGLVCGMPSIDASGISSATAGSGFVVSSAPARSNRPGTLLYNVAQMNPVPFQGGTLCVESMGLRRAGLTNSQGKCPPPADCSGVFSIDMNEFAMSNWVVPGCDGNPSGIPSNNPAGFLAIPGTTVFGQFWGRDSVATGSYVSDGLAWVVSP